MTIAISAVAGYGLPPFVTLSVTSSPSVTDWLAVYRTHEDGSTHRVLLESNATLIGSYVGIDYHAPFNQDVTYHAVSGGLTSAESAALSLLSESTWIVHPTDPALSVLVETLLESPAAYQYPTRSAQLQVLNAKLPVSRSDYPRGGESGQIVVECPDPAARVAMKALLADDGPVLLNTCYTDDDMGWLWIQPGDLTISNPAGYQSSPFRDATIPYVECRQPDSDQRVRTFDEVEADFPGATFTSMEAVYATYNDSELDIRLP